MQIAMLGPLEVRDRSGSVVDLGGARLRALLILLALEPGRVVTTSRLVDALWGDRVPAAAGNALQALVSRLRRAVPDIEVTARPTGYQMNLDPDAVDVIRFERLAAAGRAALRDDPAGAAATLRAALALWRGPALADVAEADFARSLIARLDELRLVAVEERVDAELRLGASTSLVAELEGLVAAHPLREPLVARLMRALHAAGRPGAALAAYEQLRTRLAEGLGADPSAELAALHLELLRADQPAPQASPGDTNLRAELTSFLGRDRELGEVGRLLGGYRLTTLTGPGGAGKTRLAVEAARAHLRGMPDGVWLVELAPVSDPDDLAPTVLAALGLRDQARTSGHRPVRGAEPAALDPVARLVAALSGKQAMLVLDNCEHLVAAAAELAHRILGACPSVRVLATSREPLNITGEALYPVGSLALPPAGPDIDPASVTGYAAVRLLVERAQAVRPDFRVDAGNAAAVAHMCRALDGMPLAIELAAARLRTMAPEQVAARLDDRFRLLTGGSRTALPRHQTLRAVVDWSWDLLDEAERALWRRFSVFAGGATLEAVERVCAGGPVARERVLDLLTALVDKSLLSVRGSRYRMLEIIRAYGQQRLDEAGERDAVRRAHGGYFLDFARAVDVDDKLIRAEQLLWLGRVAEDHDNFNSAIRGAVAAGDAVTAVGLVGALGWYWWLRGHKVEGVELAREALAVPGEVPDDQRAAAYAIGALMAVDGTRDKGLALAWFRASEEIVARLPVLDNPILRLIGPLRVVFDMPRPTFEPASLEALNAAVDDPHPWLAATARMIRGHLALNFGQQHGEAEADFLMALDAYRAAGDRWGTAFTLSSLATLAGWRGDFAAAVANHEQALRLVSELGTLEDVTQMRIWLARELWLLGEHDRARQMVAAAVRDARRLGLPEPQAMVAIGVAQLACEDGDLRVARTELARAAELAHRYSLAPQLLASIDTMRGFVAAAEGDLTAARRYHREAFATGQTSRDAPVIALTLVGLADLALHEGDAARAAELLGASVAVRGTPDLTIGEAARIESAARAALGDDAYQAAYRRGRSVTMSTVDKVAIS